MSRTHDQHRPARDLSLREQRDRFDELGNRQVLARAKARLEAEGRVFDPQGRIAPSAYEPLTVRERLEVVALGASLARFYAHPSFIHEAVVAGATWAEIAEAAGITSPEAARQDYLAWAGRSHRLYQDIGIGLDDGAYSAAQAAGHGQAAPGPGAELQAGI